MQTYNNQAFHEKNFYFKLALTFLNNSVPLFILCVSDMSIHIVPFYVDVMPIYHPEARE